MKKFLATVFLFSVIVSISMMAEAAYVLVPNFYDMAYNKIEEQIRFNGMDQLSEDGVRFTRWYYEVVDGKEDKYIAKYLNALNKKRDIRFAGRDGNVWYFEYTGGQAKYLNMLEGNFHIRVEVDGNDVTVDLVAGMYPN